MNTRDLQAIAETVGPYLTDGQIRQAIEYLFHLAANSPRPPRDLEKRRAERTVVTG